jgi:hypothetical protein
MKNKIPTSEAATVPACFPPGEDHRPFVVGFPHRMEKIVSPAKGIGPGREKASRVNQNGLQFLEAVIIKADNQQARLAGNRNSHFICDRKAGTPFPVFFINKDS